MSKRISTRCDVVIAGAGIGAAATAMRLLSFGFRPLLLYRQTLINQGAEALPRRAIRLFDAIGMGSLLNEADAVLVEGFETTWRDKDTIRRHEGVIHIDREALARLALATAIKHGAKVSQCLSLPQLQSGPEAVSVNFGSEKHQFFAAVDATGRFARWSRPVSRIGRNVADIFHIPHTGTLLCGKVATVAQGWAYRIDLPHSITVGVVSHGGLQQKRLDEQIARRLSLPAVMASYTGRRPAFPQWAKEPLAGRKLSVADAAIAHDPIAGQGVLFALGSALAAAAVIRTWRDLPQNKQLADSYYQELVAAEKRRHISFIEALYNHSEERDGEHYEYADVIPLTDVVSSIDASTEQSSIGATRLPHMVNFIGHTDVLGVQREGLIVPDEAIILKNGKAVRWLGKFDLLLLTKLCSSMTPVKILLEKLSQEHCPQKEGIMLIRWCLINDILAPGN